MVEAGYTHCFFVAGGNIMHILNSARTKFKCIPVVHEVAAGIASEVKILVTPGPAVTKAKALPDSEVSLKYSLAIPAATSWTTCHRRPS